MKKIFNLKRLFFEKLKVKMYFCPIKNCARKACQGKIRHAVEADEKMIKTRIR
ncbi:MAG: hypothetical protein AAGU19_19285 [Prolixibacteraceae bacterium]